MMKNQGETGPSPSTYVAVLCHHDLPRVERAVQSVGHHEGVTVAVVSHSADSTFGDGAKKIAEKHGAVHLDHASPHASCPTGKQICLEAFLDSDREYLVQVDGDDFLYSSWLVSVQDYLRRVPSLDALVILTLDRISTDDPGGFSWQVGEKWAGVWTDGTAWDEEFWGYRLGPGVSSIFGNRIMPPTFGMVRLFSRQAALAVHFRPLDEGYPEDWLLLCDLLRLHQQGDLYVCMTMRSDFYVIDASTPGSVQREKEKSAEEYRAGWRQMRDTAATLINPMRSSPAEFPVIWPEKEAGMVPLPQKVTEITQGVLSI